MKFFVMNFISIMMEENNCRQLKVEDKLKLIQLQLTTNYGIHYKKKRCEFEANLFYYFKKSESVSRMSTTQPL